jgi:SNF2 family DNA or RNA helicase
MDDNNGLIFQHSAISIMMSGRRRQRNVIIDSSSSEEEQVVAVVMDNNNPTNRVGTLGWNDDMSDSSSSLEGYLRALRIVDAPPEPENIVMSEEQVDVTSDLDDSSSGESEDLEDVEVMDEQVVVELPPTRDEEEQAGIDVDSAFSLDRSADEVYLSSDIAKNNIQWPAFRVPVTLWKRLYDYQKTGVSWMAGLHANRVGGILGDDMGMVRCGAYDPRILSRVPRSAYNFCSSWSLRSSYYFSGTKKC